MSVIFCAHCGRRIYRNPVGPFYNWWCHYGTNVPWCGTRAEPHGEETGALCGAMLTTEGAYIFCALPIGHRGPHNEERQVSDGDA